MALCQLGQLTIEKSSIDKAQPDKAGLYLKKLSFIFGKLSTGKFFFSEMKQLDEQRNEDRMRKVRKLFLKSRKRHFESQEYLGQTYNP